MHYVSDSHILASSKFVRDDWTPDPTFGNGSTAVDTRSLSFCSLPGTETTNNAYVNLGLLFYENSTGKVSALLQRGQKNPEDGGPGVTIEWIDITSLESRSLADDLRIGPDGNNATTTLYESNDGENMTFSAPFTSAANFTGSAIGALFSISNLDYNLMETGYNIATNGTGRFSSGMNCKSSFRAVIYELADLLPLDEKSYDYSSIIRSDIATFSTQYFIWINGTQPVIGPQATPRPGLPKAPFPFTRLASATFQSVTYLYHQINGTTFAEEQWNDIENFWDTPEYINVSDLSVQDSN